MNTSQNDPSVFVVWIISLGMHKKHAQKTYMSHTNKLYVETTGFLSILLKFLNCSVLELCFPLSFMQLFVNFRSKIMEKAGIGISGITFQVYGTIWTFWQLYHSSLVCHLATVMPIPQRSCFRRTLLPLA